MGLGNFNDPDPNDGNEQSTYQRISREDFEDFLDDNGWEWELVGETYKGHGFDNFTGELVYRIKGIEEDKLELRVYSSIEKSSGLSRDKGKDAIRTVIWHKEEQRPIGGRTRTHRITTWKKNLRKKIESLLDEWKDEVEVCDECGSFMAKREGQYGPFYGCLSYPRCENTKEYDD